VSHAVLIPGSLPGISHAYGCNIVAANPTLSCDSLMLFAVCSSGDGEKTVSPQAEGYLASASLRPYFPCTGACAPCTCFHLLFALFSSLRSPLSLFPPFPVVTGFSGSLNAVQSMGVGKPNNRARWGKCNQSQRAGLQGYGVWVGRCREMLQTRQEMHRGTHFRADEWFVETIRRGRMRLFSRNARGGCKEEVSPRNASCLSSRALGAFNRKSEQADCQPASTLCCPGNA